VNLPPNAVLLLHPTTPCTCGTEFPGWSFAAVTVTIQDGVSVGETSYWDCTSCRRRVAYGRLNRDNLAASGKIEVSRTGHSAEEDELP
jgi:hypothetical protein